MNVWHIMKTIWMIAFLAFGLCAHAQANFYTNEAVFADVATCRDLLLRYVHGKDRHLSEEVRALPVERFIALLESVLADEYSKYVSYNDKKSREAEGHLGAILMILDLAPSNLAFLGNVGRKFPDLRPIVWRMYIYSVRNTASMDIVRTTINDPDIRPFVDFDSLCQQLYYRFALHKKEEEKTGNLLPLCMFLLEVMLDENNKILSYGGFEDDQFCEVIPGYDNSVQRQVLIRRRLASQPDDVALREKFRPVLDHFERLPKDRLIDLGERLGDLPKLKAAHD